MPALLTSTSTLPVRSRISAKASAPSGCAKSATMPTAGPGQRPRAELGLIPGRHHPHLRPHRPKAAAMARTDAVAAADHNGFVREIHGCCSILSLAASLPGCGVAPGRGELRRPGRHLAQQSKALFVPGGSGPPGWLRPARSTQQDVFKETGRLLRGRYHDLATVLGRGVTGNEAVRTSVENTGTWRRHRPSRRPGPRRAAPADVGPGVLLLRTVAGRRDRVPGPDTRQGRSKRRQPHAARIANMRRAATSRPG